MRSPSLSRSRATSSRASRSAARAGRVAGIHAASWPPHVARPRVARMLGAQDEQQFRTDRASRSTAATAAAGPEGGAPSRRESSFRARSGSPRSSRPFPREILPPLPAGRLAEEIDAAVAEPVERGHDRQRPRVEGGRARALGQDARPVATAHARTAASCPSAPEMWARSWAMSARAPRWSVAVMATRTAPHFSCPSTR